MLNNDLISTPNVKYNFTLTSWNIVFGAVLRSPHSGRLLLDDVNPTPHPNKLFH